MLALDLDVMVETNGSRDISVLPPGVRRIVDFKLPSSGMAETMLPANYRRLTNLDEVKFVVGSREDFDFALEVVARHALSGKCALLVSPVWGKVALPELASWIIKANAPLRMQVQLHKLVWNDERGV